MQEVLVVFNFKDDIIYITYKLWLCGSWCGCLHSFRASLCDFINMHLTPLCVI